MGRRSIGLGVVLAATITVDAGAQTAVTVKSSPSRANSPARLVVDAEGGSAAQVVPQAITVLVERGFRFDRRAVGRLCRASQARAGRCPAQSRIGSGSILVRVDGPTPNAVGSGVFPGEIDAFAGPASQPGDLAGLVMRLTIAGRTIVSGGRIAPVFPGPLGMSLAFDPLPQPPALPEGYTSTMIRMHAEIGATRTAKRTVTRTVRREGRTVRRKVTRRVRYHLIRTPPACDGAWAVQTLVRYPEGEDVLDATIACRRSSRRR